MSLGILLRAMIETEYTIDYEDYKAAQRLYLRHRRWAMVVYLLFQWVLPAIAVGFVGWTLFLWLSTDYRDLPFVGGITAGLLWMSFIFLLNRKLTIRRGYRNLFPKGVTPITRLTADEAQLISAIPGRSEGRFFWAAIEDYAEDDRMALLFIRRKLFLMVPRRALNEAQWGELRALVTRKRGQVTRA